MTDPVRDIIDELQDRGLLPLARVVAKRHSVTLPELLGGSHALGPATARRVLWAVLRARGYWSYPRLGALFRRDHSTILDGCRKVLPAVVAAIEQAEGAA